MFTVTLVVHIAGALSMAVVSALVLGKAWADDHASVRYYVSRLSYLLAAQLVTGSMMVFITPKEVAFGDFCQNITLYVLATSAIFFLAWWKTREGRAFARSLAPVISGLCVSAVTAFALL